MQDPNSAPMIIAGLWSGVDAVVKVSRDGPGLANIKRRIKADQILQLGKVFADNDSKPSSLRNFCKLRCSEAEMAHEPKPTAVRSINVC